MIIEGNSKGQIKVQTDGCGCCSEYLDLESDREEILDYIKDSLIVFKSMIEYYGIDWSELLKANNLEK